MGQIVGEEANAELDRDTVPPVVFRVTMGGCDGEDPVGIARLPGAYGLVLVARS